jgi:hypothetical protein
MSIVDGNWLTPALGVSCHPQAELLVSDDWAMAVEKIRGHSEFSEAAIVPNAGDDLGAF